MSWVVAWSSAQREDGGVRLAVSLHFVGLVQVQLAGQALGVDDGRVAAAAAVARWEMQQGERAGGQPRMQSCGVGHRPYGHVRQCGHVGQEPQLTRHHGGTAYGAAHQRLIQGLGHQHGGAGPGQQDPPGQAVIDHPINLFAAQAGAGDESAGDASVRSRPGTCPCAYPVSAHAASSRAV